MPIVHGVCIPTEDGGNEDSLALFEQMKEFHQKPNHTLALGFREARLKPHFQGEKQHLLLTFLCFLMYL
ncbi:MAG: hypothetical protein Q9M15_01095 [Mariprofundaceae bacterium]|nr:hypothetical protein [Mariprofundaceae bacterium]